MNDSAAMEGLPAKVVVTGASGNLGTALLRRLAGRTDLIAISRRRPPDVDPYRCATWVPVDLARPDAHERLVPAFTGASAIVHLAWMIQPGRDRELLRRTNQGGTQAVLDAAQRAGVPHVVHLSSVGAYSTAPPATIVDETWPTEGISTSSYSVDKAAAEREVERTGDFAKTVLRPGLILQPDAASEISRYFIGRLVPVSLLHPTLLRLVPWPSRLATQFVHADDVAQAIALALIHRADGRFNVVSEPVIDRRAFGELFGPVLPPIPPAVLRALVNATWRAHLQPTDPGWIDLAFGSPLLSSAKLATELGWRPRHRADELLSDFVAALRRRQGWTGPLLHRRRLSPHG